MLLYAKFYVNSLGCFTVAVRIVWRAELLCVEPENELASMGFYEV
jgi:hypothetical protein